MASSPYLFSPPYPDVLAAESSNLSDEDKYRVLTESWEKVHLYNFPTRYNYVNCVTKVRNCNGKLNCNE